MSKSSFLRGLMVSVLLAAIVLPLSGCGNNDKSPYDALQPLLRQLVEAERRGETESFAQLRGLDLVDGSVRVEIEARPGQLEAAVKATADLGTVEIVAQRREELQALIPITSLTALAKERSIHFIRKPIRPVEGTNE